MTPPATAKPRLAGRHLLGRVFLFSVVSVWVIYMCVALRARSDRVPAYLQRPTAEPASRATPEALAPSGPVNASGKSQHTGALRMAAQAEAPAGTVALSWKKLGGFTYSRAMQLPGEVRGLNQKDVSITGFMLPFDRESKITDFALVEALWSCCFGTPPDVNQVIIVNATDLGGVDLARDPIHVVGTLDVGERTDADGTIMSVYRLRAKMIQPLK